jgi:hypothetical protein
MSGKMKIPVGAEEHYQADKKGFELIVGRYPNGNPQNRIIIRPVNNVDPTKDIVFEAIVRDERLVLQYPLYFKLEKMFQMLEFIRENESKIVKSAKSVWKV